MTSRENLIDELKKIFGMNTELISSLESLGLIVQFYKDSLEISRVFLPYTCFVSYIISARVLKNLDSELLKLLSNKSGVYFLVNEGKLGYVGKSDAAGGIYSRVCNHLGTKKFDYVIITVSEHPYCTITSIISNVEDYFIEKYRPTENIAKGVPSRTIGLDLLTGKVVCGQLELLLSSRNIFPNPKPVSLIAEGILDKMVHSSHVPGKKYRHRGLISDMNLSKGQEIVFTLDRSIHAFVDSDSTIKIYGSDGSYNDRYTLSSFCTTWNIETGRRKSGNTNTMAGPKYWETLDGINLNSL